MTKREDPAPVKGRLILVSLGGCQTSRTVDLIDGAALPAAVRMGDRLFKYRETPFLRRHPSKRRPSRVFTITLHETENDGGTYRQVPDAKPGSLFARDHAARQEFYRRLLKAAK